MKDSKPLQQSKGASIWFAQIVSVEMGKTAALFRARQMSKAMQWKCELQHMAYSPPTGEGTWHLQVAGFRNEGGFWDCDLDQPRLPYRWQYIFLF